MRWTESSIIKIFDQCSSRLVKFVIYSIIRTLDVDEEWWGTSSARSIVLNNKLNDVQSGEKHEVEWDFA